MKTLCDEVPVRNRTCWKCKKTFLGDTLSCDVCVGSDIHVGITMENTIIIDGVEYVRKDAQDVKQEKKEVQLPKFWISEYDEHRRDFFKITADGFVVGEGIDQSYSDMCFKFGNYYEYSPEAEKHFEAKVELRNHVVKLIRKYGCSVGDGYFTYGVGNHKWVRRTIDTEFERNISYDFFDGIHGDSTEEERNERARLLKLVYS